MIDLQTAAEFLNFGARIGAGERADEQLKGAVAVHNLLDKHGIAYLADEVGMGKTYVALGALALFRHFRPDFRVLIIAPRENIQFKWMKELRNFIAYNVRFPDLRVKSPDGHPVKPLVACANLLELVREATLDRDRDFFLRLTSFSLPVAGRESVDAEAARRLREGLRSHLPWLDDGIFDLRSKEAFKDNVARAICCALPVFDLVIVDEGHNLKHGFGEWVSARNRVLALTMGHPDGAADRKLFPGFAPRARRVLFLSATPVEETYRHLWNQLHVFGFGQPFTELASGDVDEAELKKLAGQFLVRRVTSLRVAGVEHTKNLYRREWRRGGVAAHDEPIRVEDPRQRLVVALVQKKVSELLGHERFGSSFQIGMLASFESFLETARLKRDEPEEGNFDDAEQTDDALAREGMDVAQVNRLAKSYRQCFGKEMPHPKMDALVDSLADAWRSGRKSLVFVRRVASVKELKRKLDERYDEWLTAKLRRELPEEVHRRLEDLIQRYRAEKFEGEQRAGAVEDRKDEDADRGGNDTFFAWFFRGEGPRGVVSGANIQQRFIQRGAAYATFFEDNYVAAVLGCRPEEVEQRLTATLGISSADLRSGLQERSRRFLSRARNHGGADRFIAVQAAAIEWLKDQEGPSGDAARVVWHCRFEGSHPQHHTQQPPEIGDWLQLHTFFTELRLRPGLCARLWPVVSHADATQAFREQAMRAQLLASAARLGHGLIDLYVMTIRRLGSLELRAQEAAEGDGGDRTTARIHEYLDLLERQMGTPLSSRDWGAFDELAEIAEHFDLIIDANGPEARSMPVAETARLFGQLLRQQQPVGGMSGQVNQTLVRQFRMPGYPLVLVTTDLLQEGEDLHTFCSAVHHYGISWTPSGMEQRIGRIDRVRSQTDRRLAAVSCGDLAGEEKLQVYFPHLEDTVEVLQVQRVLERMNVFLRLMHSGLLTTGREESTINAAQEFARVRRAVPQVLGLLHSAFPVRPDSLQGDGRPLAVCPDRAAGLLERFASIRAAQLPDVDVTWEPHAPTGTLLGTARLADRVQPFNLLLKSMGAYPLVRCISPVGCVGPADDAASVAAGVASRAPIKIGAILTEEERTYDLTVEGDVLLGPAPEHDRVRIAMLIRRVVNQADALEQEQLPGKDEVLDTFRDELSKEGRHGD